MMLASTNYQRVMCQTVSVKVTHFRPFTPPPMSHQSIMSHVNSTGHSNITVELTDVILLHFSPQESDLRDFYCRISFLMSKTTAHLGEFTKN